MPLPDLTRRTLLATGALASASALAGCAGSTRNLPVVGGLFGNTAADGTISRPDYQVVYAGFQEQFPVPAFDYRQVDPRFLRQEVVYRGGAPAGSIVVDPRLCFLFFVEPGRRATRYGVGVGREGFAWSGHARINMKRAWPDWVPPRAMVERDPGIVSQLEPTSRGEGVPGGPRSPLGARAMYLYGPNGDLGYRIHGTTEPETIGTDVSSGCIRMVDQDIIHLYSRTPLGTAVTVLGGDAGANAA